MKLGNQGGHRKKKRLKNPLMPDQCLRCKPVTDLWTWSTCWPGLTSSFLSLLVHRSQDPDWTAWRSHSVGEWVECMEKEPLRKQLYTRGKHAGKNISEWEMYLEVPLQSCDILTANLHVIESHLRRKETEGLSRSTAFPASSQLNWMQLNKLVKRLFKIRSFKKKSKH